MENLQELFEDTIKDLYNAEKQFLKAMPKLVESANSPKLKKVIEAHIAQSEGQVQRLEKIAALGGFKTSGKECKAAKGLVDECSEHLAEGQPGATLDAAIIACAQKNEHYEICSYGTVLSWAETLGHEKIATMLEKSLQEEVEADELLSDVAEMVNMAAVGGSTRASLKNQGSVNGSGTESKKNRAPAKESKGDQSGGMMSPKKDAARSK